VSAMTYVWRHPKTSVYYFRRGVPQRLRSAIGKTMIQASLGTKDVTEGCHTGHSNSSVGRRYGQGEPLDVLAEAIATMRFPVDLQRLHR
jgi:hypothetical protein